MEFVDLGWRQTFPDEPSGQLGAAVAAGKVVAQETSQELLDSPATLVGFDESDEFTDIRLAMEHGIGGLTGYHLDDRGEAVGVHLDDMRNVTAHQVLARGGAIVFDNVHRFSSNVARIAKIFSAARGAPVRAFIVRGSLSNDMLGGEYSWTAAAALSEGIIAQVDQGQPFDLQRGAFNASKLPPRLYGGVDRYTLCFAERRFDQGNMIRLLSHRGLAHPLMRVDLPVDLDSGADVYGVGEDVSFPSVFEAEWSALRAAADDRLLSWWWLLEQHYEPTSLPGGQTDSLVRAWFPGGVGVSNLADGVIAYHLGHQAVVLSDNELGVLEMLMSGGTLKATFNSPYGQFLMWLAHTGYLEVASEPAYLDVVPARDKGPKTDHETDAGEEFVVSRHIDGLGVCISASGFPPGDVRTLEQFVQGHEVLVGQPDVVLHMRRESPFVYFYLEEGPDISAIGLRDRYDASGWQDGLYHWLDRLSLYYGDTQQLRLHAASFERDGITWLVVGDSGSGKSSITTHAVSQGSAFLTDERVTLSTADRKVVSSGLTQPIRRLTSHDPRSSAYDVALLPQPPVRKVPNVPTRLVLLTSRTVENPTAAWLVATLAQHVRNLEMMTTQEFEVLPDLVDQVHVALTGARTVLDVGDLNPQPIPRVERRWVPPEMIPPWNDYVVSVEAMTLCLGDEAVIWLRDATHVVVHLTAAATSVWLGTPEATSSSLVRNELSSTLTTLGILRKA